MLWLKLRDNTRANAPTEGEEKLEGGNKNVCQRFPSCQISHVFGLDIYICQFLWPNVIFFPSPPSVNVPVTMMSRSTAEGPAAYEGETIKPNTSYILKGPPVAVHLKRLSPPQSAENGHWCENGVRQAAAG